MTISTAAIGVLIAFVSAGIGLFFNMRGSRQKDEEKIREEGVQEGKVISKLDEIGIDVKDIKYDISETKKEVSDLKKEVAVNEKAIEALHGRLDRHIKKEKV